MSHVVEINDVRELEAYRLAWQSLLPETPNVSFFHSLDWLEIYWRQFGQGQKLRVLVVHAANKPIGILPLCVRIDRHRFGNVRTLTYPTPRWVHFFGPIGPNPTATLLVAMRYLRESDRDWDVIDLPAVDVAGTDRGRTERALNAQGLVTTTEEWSQAAIVDLVTDWDAYLADRGATWWKEHQLRKQRLEMHGDVTLVRHRPQGSACGDDNPRWDLYEACGRISRRSENNGLVASGAVQDEQVRRFLREIHAQAVGRGMVDVCVLFVGRQAVAYLYSYHVHGRLLTVRVGVDPAHAALGAESVLLAEAVRDSFARGDRQWELPPAQDDRFASVATTVTKSHQLLHFAALDVRAQAVRLQRWRRRRAEAKLDSADQETAVQASLA